MASCMRGLFKVVFSRGESPCFGASMEIQYSQPPHYSVFLTNEGLEAS